MAMSLLKLRLPGAPASISLVFHPRSLGVADRRQRGLALTAALVEPVAEAVLAAMAVPVAEAVPAGVAVPAAEAVLAAMAVPVAALSADRDCFFPWANCRMLRPDKKAVGCYIR